MSVQSPALPRPAISTEPITVEVFANNRLQAAVLHSKQDPELGFEVILRPATPFAITVTNRTNRSVMMTIAAENALQPDLTPEWWTTRTLKPGDQEVFHEWASEWPFLAGYNRFSFSYFEITARPENTGNPQYGFSYRLWIATVTQRELERQ